MRANQFVPGYVSQEIQVESKFTDYELAVMEGGLSLDKPKSALHQAVSIVEAFDKPYEILRWEQGDFGDVDAIARLDDNTFLSIMFNKGVSKDSKEEAWSVEFYRNNSQEVTGEGDSQRVFATVLSAMQTFIKKYKPNRITFTASKEVEQGQNTQSRARLYDSLVQRYARSWGFRAFRADTGNKVIYELNRIQPVAEAKQDVDENFAETRNSLSALREAVKQVNEIERIPQSSFSGNDDDDDDYDDEDDYGEETQVDLHKLPGNNKFMYSAEKVNNTSNGPGMEVAIWIDDETVIGELVLSDANYPPFNNALQVDTITVDKKYRSQGIGTSLYGVVLNILKKTLLAGESQTPGGRKMWMALASIPGVEVKGYVSIHNADLKVPQFPSHVRGTNEFEKEVDQRIDIIMGKLGGQYIGDNSQGNKHYFAFDVIPSTGELAPAVKTALSKIYINDDDYDNNDDYEFGLYAVWNGAVNENFADGKVKGKSRPGRVKRSGASCQGSVSDLRSKAKNASGERAKMYHWCANMKSGRADESTILEELETTWKSMFEAGIFKGYPCTKDCSGHAAGYKWSDDRDITDPNLCPYSNNSFWEGCLAHTDEQE